MPGMSATASRILSISSSRDRALVHSPRGFSVPTNPVLSTPRASTATPVWPVRDTIVSSSGNAFRRRSISRDVSMALSSETPGSICTSMSKAPSSITGMNSVPRRGRTASAAARGTSRDHEHRGAVREGPAQRGHVEPPGHREDGAVGVNRPQHQQAHGRDDEDREQQRRQERQRHREGQRREHLAFHPCQRDDRDEGQGDDQLAEDARLAHLDRGPQHRRPRSCRPRPGATPGGAARSPPG